MSIVTNAFIWDRVYLKNRTENAEFDNPLILIAMEDRYVHIHVFYCDATH